MQVSKQSGLCFSPPWASRGYLHIIGFITVLLFTFCSPQPQAEASGQELAMTSESLVIQIEPTHDLATIEAVLMSHGMTFGRTWPEFGLAEVRPLPAETHLRAAGASALDAHRRVLEAVPGVRHAEFDSVVTAADRSLIQPSYQDGLHAQEFTPATETPADSLNADQWAHERINVFESWKISRGDPAVAIAVIDSGCDIDHEDINRDSLWINVAERDGKPGIDDDQNGFVDDLHGWDWIDNDDVANDPYGHGTHVGGAIAADTDNALGISSLGPDLRIAPLRVLDAHGVGLISDLIDALYYAYQQDIRVVNMSLVIQLDSDALRKAVETAARSGMVLVAASGNHSASVSWPAKYPETVAVAATDHRDVRGPFSNFGPETDLAAPGVDILSTYRDNSYHSLSGTSMATAHVSALAALVWSVRPDLPADEVRSLLRESSLDVNESSYPGVDDYLGAGRIDYLAALCRASMTLQLQTVSMEPVVAYSGESAVASIAVTVGGDASMAVTGAVVHYQVLSAAGRPELDEYDTQVGRAVTDAEGIAKVILAVPEDQGMYILRLQSGLAVLELPLEVVERLTTVELIPPSNDLVVGDTGVPLQIAIHDEQGKPVASELIVRLKTDTGHFGNGQTEMDVRVRDSLQTLFFYPGRVAGTATVTVQLGKALRKHEMTVVPEQAAQIGLTSSVSPVRNWAASDSSSIHLDIADRYGNPVADGTYVHLMVDRGRLAETHLASRAGSVSTTLTVPSGVKGPAHVWAAVLGTTAEVQVDVPLMSHVYWLPLLAVN